MLCGLAAGVPFILKAGKGLNERRQVANTLFLLYCIINENLDYNIAYTYQCRFGD